MSTVFIWDEFWVKGIVFMKRNFRRNFKERKKKTISESAITFFGLLLPICHWTSIATSENFDNKIIGICI